MNNLGVENFFSLLLLHSFLITELHTDYYFFLLWEEAYQTFKRDCQIKKQSHIQYVWALSYLCCANILLIFSVRDTIPLIKVVRELEICRRSRLMLLTPLRFRLGLHTCSVQQIDAQSSQQISNSISSREVFSERFTPLPLGDGEKREIKQKSARAPG